MPLSFYICVCIATTAQRAERTAETPFILHMRMYCDNNTVSFAVKGNTALSFYICVCIATAKNYANHTYAPSFPCAIHLIHTRVPCGGGLYAANLLVRTYQRFYVHFKFAPSPNGPYLAECYISA